MTDYIIKKLKDYYNDGFLKASCVVYLLHVYIGKKKAIEIHTKNLGSTEEEINCALDELFKTYPSDKFYCVFSHTTEYKSEKAKKEFLEKYYKGDSRIPEMPVSIEDMNYTDSFGIRVRFINKQEYENLPTSLDEFDFYDYSEQIVFYKYYDDSLYQKEKEAAQKWFEKNNSYLLKPLNKKEYLIERYGFIRDLGKNIKKLKEAIQEKLGDLFVSWNVENDISLRVTRHEGKKYLVITENSKTAPDQYIHKDFISLKKLIVDKKFKTDQEVAQFIKDNLSIERILIRPEEATEKKYDDYTIIDTHEWIRMPTSPTEQKKYDLKDWSHVQSTINDILKK